MAGNQPFFDLPLENLGLEIIGRKLVLLDGRMLTIAGVDMFHRRENMKGAYRPMLDMQPGEVYVPFVQGHPMFLIVALDNNGQSGACVRVIEVHNHQDGTIIQGPGRVGRYVGFTQASQRGHLELIDDDSLSLVVDGTLDPKMPATNGGKGGKPITDRVLETYTDQLADFFLKNTWEGETYEAFLERIKREWGTVSQLKSELGLR